ncbi:MAG: EI24 domain-containing protein [Bdellovibrionota bacterium]
MIRHAKGALAGFFIPWTGLGLIFSDKRIARFALLPFVVTIVFFGTGLAFGLTLISGWVTPLTTWLIGVFGIASASQGAAILSWLLPIALWPTLAIALCLLIWMVVRVVVGPLFTLLAEAVLVSTGGLAKKEFSFVDWTATNVRMFRVSIVRMAIFGTIGFVLVVLSLIPGVGLLAAVAMLHILAFDLADYALEAYEWGLRKRIAFYRRHFSVFFGLACVLGLVFLIPGLNFFLLPASVAGASDVVRRLVASDSNP